MKKKYSKNAVNRAIERIKKEEKERLMKIDKPFIEAERRMALLLSTPEKKTFKSRKEVQRFKEDLSKARIKKEELENKQLQRKLKKSFVKVESRVERGLERTLQGLKKLGKKKVVSRRVIKPSKATLILKDKQEEGVFEDPNRFFKREMEETKRSMFF